MSLYLISVAVAFTYVMFVKVREVRTLKFSKVEYLKLFMCSLVWFVPVGIVIYRRINHRS